MGMTRGRADGSAKTGWGGCFKGKQVKDCRWAWFQPDEYRKVAGWPPRRVRNTVLTQNVVTFLLVEQAGTCNAATQA